MLHRELSQFFFLLLGFCLQLRTYHAKISLSFDNDNNKFVGARLTIVIVLTAPQLVFEHITIVNLITDYYVARGTAI